MAIGQIHWENPRWNLYRVHIQKVRPELENVGLLA